MAGQYTAKSYTGMDTSRAAVTAACNIRPVHHYAQHLSAECARLPNTDVKLQDRQGPDDMRIIAAQHGHEQYDSMSRVAWHEVVLGMT